MQETEFIEPSPTGRLRLGLYVMIVTICSLPFITWKPMAAYLKTLPMCEGLPWARAYLLSAFAVGMLVVVFFGWLGYQTVRTGQTPLPDAIVFRRTKVIRGARVVLRGYFLCGLAVVLLAFLLYVALHGWPLFRPLFVSGICGAA